MNLRVEDNLPTKDKWPVPDLFSLRRFYCGSMASFVKSISQISTQQPRSANARWAQARPNRPCMSLVIKFSLRSITVLIIYRVGKVLAEQYSGWWERAKQPIRWAQQCVEESLVSSVEGLGHTGDSHAVQTSHTCCKYAIISLIGSPCYCTTRNISNIVIGPW